MTIRHLTIFICVCDEKTMTRAAEKLHIAQPSVSQVIQELESHYNVQLFERLGRRLFLTAAGEKLLTYARHIVNLHSKTEADMRQFGLIYRVRLGASVTIGESILIDLLSQLRDLYPQNEIISSIHNTAILEKMLLDDKLDMALVEGKIVSEYLTVTPFMRDELIFIAAPQHHLVGKVNITANDLAAELFFVREEGSGTRNLFENVMQASHVNYRIAGMYNNAETIKKAVAAGLGISVISRMAVRHELTDGRLCQLKIPEFTFQRQFSIAHHKNKYISPELKNIILLCNNADRSV